MRRAFPIMLVALFLFPLAAHATSIKAYYDGVEATVEDVSVLIGQPMKIELKVVPDGDAVVHAMLYEPGYVKAYDIKDEVKTVRVRAGEGALIAWTATPGGEWAGAKAPLNIYYKVLEEKDGPGDKLTTGEFTVVNAYIENERFETGNACTGTLLFLFIVGLSLRSRVE